MSNRKSAHSAITETKTNKLCIYTLYTTYLFLKHLQSQECKFLRQTAVAIEALLKAHKNFTILALILSEA